MRCLQSCVYGPCHARRSDAFQGSRPLASRRFAPAEVKTAPVSEPAIMSNARAVRYRRLALASGDKANADLLLKLADECDRGLLCTAEWATARLSRKNEKPSQAGDAKFQF